MGCFSSWAGMVSMGAGPLGSGPPGAGPDGLISPPPWGCVGVGVGSGSGRGCRALRSPTGIGGRGGPLGVTDSGMDSWLGADAGRDALA